MDITNLKGVGVKKKEKLNNSNIYSVEDLLYFFPKAYEKMNDVKFIKDIIAEEKVTLILKVLNIKRYFKGKRPILNILAEDSTGRINIVFFNQDYLYNILYAGIVISIFGKPKRGHRGLSITNPEYKVIEKKQSIKKEIRPIYRLVNKLSNTEIINLQKQAINNLDRDEIKKQLPTELIKYNKLCSEKFALTNIHFPTNLKKYRIAKYRLIYEEFFHLLYTLQIKKNENKNLKGYKIKKSKEIDQFINSLPFKLTLDQIKVLEEVYSDIKKGSVMARLIQGDVGSGKTIIAIITLINSALEGYQGSLMVPTEVLAKQHFETINKFLKNSYDINIELLTSSTKNKELIKEKIKKGLIDIVIGTHAIIQDDVVFKNLGIVITDEEHRFGVNQRNKLSKKGIYPHILFMSATPIPRSLAHILYGDLDVSTINNKPQGRMPISTSVYNKNNKYRAYKRLLNEIKKGHQAYIVCPLIEDSESIEAVSVKTLYEELTKFELENYNIRIIHGKLKNEEKSKIMDEFKNGNIDVLISTTVIEVGVDNSNATIMIIENAERFGLAQLHQLRGRVGRGDFKSYCYLLYNNDNEKTNDRLKVMEKTQSGFDISKEDLEIRGPGEFFGLKQHGVFNLKIADLFKHNSILNKVREDIEKFLS